MRQNKQTDCNMHEKVYRTETMTLRERKKDKREKMICNKRTHNATLVQVYTAAGKICLCVRPAVYNLKQSNEQVSPAVRESHITISTPKNPTAGRMP